MRQGYSSLRSFSCIILYLHALRLKFIGRTPIHEALTDQKTMTGKGPQKAFVPIFTAGPSNAEVNAVKNESPWYQFSVILSGERIEKYLLGWASLWGCNYLNCLLPFWPLYKDCSLVPVTTAGWHRFLIDVHRMTMSMLYRGQSYRNANTWGVWVSQSCQC